MRIEIPDLTNKECGEIAVTAAEGGIGYWSVIDDYSWTRWTDPETMDSLDVPDEFVFYRIRFENPDVGAPQRRSADITPGVLRSGIERAVEHEYPVVLHLMTVDREDWTGEIDSDLADIIVQCGVFGEVVFS